MFLELILWLNEILLSAVNEEETKEDSEEEIQGFMFSALK